VTGWPLLVLAVAAPAGPPAVVTVAPAIILAGRLHYQACNELVCLRPSSSAVEVRVGLRPGRTAR
jgi:hypothetical protein